MRRKKLKIQKVQIEKPETPELDKMAAVRGQSQIIGNFLEWFYLEGYDATIWMEKTEELLSKYFKIDQNKVEQERRLILQALRDAQNPKVKKAPARKSAEKELQQVESL